MPDWIGYLLLDGATFIGRNVKWLALGFGLLLFALVVRFIMADAKWKARKGGAGI